MNRYSTAAAIAGDASFTGTTAILATGQNFPDALAASGLAGDNAPAPIVLSTTSSLSDEALGALDDLGATDVIIVGGTAAISAAVADELTAEGFDVSRVAGVDRYETAGEIAGAIGSAADLNGLATAVIATGLNYPDALAGGPVAYVGGFPLLLTNDTVPAATEAALTDLGVEQVLILGGTAAVSTAVENDLEDITGNDSVRLAGVNRFGTAAEVAEFGLDEGLLDANDVLLASGSNFPDALAGGPLGGELTAPIILTSSLPAESEAFLDDHSDTITDLIALGGTAAIDDATLDDAQAAAENIANDGAASNQTFAVTPAESAVLPVSTLATTNEGARSYTVAGLDNTKTYDIELHEAEDILVTGNVVTFTNNTPIAPAAAPNTSLETVNGAVVGTAGGVAATEAHNVGPVGGTITFTIDSTIADRVIPVLSGDTDADNTLDLVTGTGFRAPSEPFGIGGETEWVPAEAASGVTGTDFTITRSSTSGDYLIANGATYYYDANDTFSLASAPLAGNGADGSCVQVTQETFEANLSTNDELDGTSNYNADPAFASSLCLVDLTPGSPTAVLATASGSNVTVTWAAPASTANSYNIYRQTDPTPLVADCVEGLPDAENAYVKVGSSTTLTFTDLALANGNYCYAVTSVLDGDESTVAAGADDEDDVVTPFADAIAPQTLTNGAVVDVNTDLTLQASTNDVLTLIFSEPVTVAANAAIVVNDGTDTATITNGGNSTWSTNANIVTITLTATLLEAVTLDPLGYPLTVTDRAGVTDSAGNAWSLGGGDLTVEDDGPEFVSETATTGATSFTVTFNEALNLASAQTAANYLYDADGAGAVVAAAPTSAVLSADGKTVTLTVATAVAAGATLDPLVTLTDVEGQGATQAATAIN